MVRLLRTIQAGEITPYGLVKILPNRIAQQWQWQTPKLILLFPIFIHHARKYDVAHDAFGLGWWFFVLKFEVQRAGHGKQTFGWSFSVKWGWTRVMSCKMTYDFERKYNEGKA